MALRSAVFRALLAFFALLAAFMPIKPAAAGWPSAEKVVETVAPLAGINADQVEFVKFALKKPSCASTIVSYTAAQDYSLVAFIAALKATKFQSVPQLPKMSGSQCKAYNPVQQAYLFIDGVGNRFLGQSKADAMRGLLKEQIAEGKSTLDAQIASIPYVGTILTNWDCECDAAFMTNFKDEKIIDQRLGDVIFIGKAVKSGDIISALERMIVSLGPKAACDLGAQWSGVSSVPLVSDIASSACEGVAGKAVGWVISGTGALAEGLGIIGGEHIPPEQYYKQMFTPEIGKHKYEELAEVLHGKCYAYFEPTNMAVSTAKKVCATLRARYLDESAGKLQNEAFYKEYPDYQQKVLAPLAAQGVMMTDAEFAGVASGAKAACDSYFSQKYSKALAYRNAYKAAEAQSENSFCQASDFIFVKRRQAQAALVDKTAKKLQPLCKTGTTKNTLICEDVSIASCFAELSDICLKAADNSMQRPCCQLGSGMDATTAWTGKFAQEMAASIGGPFCKGTKADPLAIVCMTKPIYQRCLQGYKGTLPPDCASAEKHPGGVSKSLCCRFDESDLAGVAGVKDVQSFVKGQNIVKSGSCAIGGMLKGLSYDPRIVNCLNGAASDACKKAFPSECVTAASGFVSAPCCDISVFGSEAAGKTRPYNPAERSAEDLALAAKALANAKGGCATAKGPGSRQEDAFRLVCKTEAALKQCVKDLGRLGQTACNKKLSANGWATSPCCERSMESLSGRASETPVNNISAPKAADIKLPGGGLGSGGTTPRAGTGIGAGRSNTVPQDTGKVRAPSPAGSRLLSPSPAPAPRNTPGSDAGEKEDVPARAPSPYKP